IAEGAGADARKRQRGDALIRGKLDAAPIARGEELRFSLRTAVPHRADRVNHVPGGQAVALGELGVTDLAATERTAFREKVGAGGAVDRAVNASASEQARVRGVDDRVHRELRDVAANRAQVRRRHGLATVPSSRNGGSLRK